MKGIHIIMINLGEVLPRFYMDGTLGTLALVRVGHFSVVQQCTVPLPR